MHSMPRRGKQLWKYEPNLDAESFKTACCDVVNRGVALYGQERLCRDVERRSSGARCANGRARMEEGDVRSGRRLCVLARTARTRWRACRRQLGWRIWRTRLHRALDPNDGKVLWKRYTVPGAKEPGGNTWPDGMQEHGGAPAWLTGTYDAASKTLYWGVGNPGPWLADLRPGRQSLFRFLARARSEDRATSSGTINTRRMTRGIMTA